MRAPPELSNKALNQHCATSILGLLAIAATAAWWMGADVAPLYQDMRAFRGEPWRFVTSVLLHINLWHLVFNLYWLWVFGTLVEEVFGHLPAAGLFLVLGAGSSVVAGAVGEDGVGLSGVGYGLFGLLWVLSRRDERFADAVDGRTVVLFIGWFILCIVLTWTGTWNVGNVAHGAGAGLGGLVGLAVAQPARRRLYTGLTALTIVLAVAAGTLWRPSLNLFARAGSDDARLAYEALDQGDSERAVALYRSALAADEEQADWWYNLGVAHGRLHRAGEAEAAFEQAVRLKPSDRGFRAALAQWTAYLARQSQIKGEHKDAVRRFRRAVELDATDAASWHNLSVSYGHLGDRVAAERALARAVELQPLNGEYRVELARLREAQG